MNFENPYLDIDAIKKMLPEDHPNNEITKLTLIQSIAYPILMWFFDSDRNRGTGKSHLMAVICIELAKRGRKVYIRDASVIPHMDDDYKSTRGVFERLVFNIMRQFYPKDIFEYSRQEGTLVYKGRRPK